MINNNTIGVPTSELRNAEILKPPSPEVSIEKIATPEKLVENDAVNIETPKITPEQNTAIESLIIKGALDNQLRRVKNPDSAISQNIEKILANGLDSMFLKLGPRQQQVFKGEGERIVEFIKQGFNNKKIKHIEAIEQIEKWLSLVYGLDSPYVKKEAHIKFKEIVIKIGAKL